MRRGRGNYQIARMPPANWGVAAKLAGIATEHAQFFRLPGRELQAERGGIAAANAGALRPAGGRPNVVNSVPRNSLRY
jgi:hypothetical protein